MSESEPPEYCNKRMRPGSGRGAGRSCNPCRGACRWSSSTRGFAFAHPRLISFRPAAEYVAAFMKSCPKARAEINSHFGASAGRADARRRDEGDVGHRRGAATKPIRALRRRAPAARRPAGFVARSSHTSPGIARRSRLASGPGGQQQNVNLFLREP